MSNLRSSYSYCLYCLNMLLSNKRVSDMRLWSVIFLSFLLLMSIILIQIQLDPTKVKKYIK